jgi:HAMP domain-containing protein
MFEKIGKWAIIALMIALVALAGFATWKYNDFQRQIRELQNKVAEKDVTIEVQKQVFSKLTQQFEDMKLAIDTSTEEGKNLANEIKKQKAEIVSVTNALVKLKTQVAQGTGGQTDVPGQKPGDPTRKKVTFEKDFGYALVTGFTLTDPPEYHLELGQGSKPLKLATVVTQQKDGSWRSYVTSSDSNVSFDIGVSAVNPLVFEPSWYEKLKLHLDLGVGSALIGGIGASYQIGQFDFGPTVWFVGVRGSDDKYVGGTAFGLNFSWAPFKK